MTISHVMSPLVRLSPNTESASERALLDELVSRLRSRDDVVIDRVLRELVPEVRRWMFRHLGPRADIEDATQDALSEIASALHRFEGRSSVVTLAHRIALRTSYRYYRRQGQHDAAPNERGAGADAPRAIDMEKQVAARHALARLHHALAQLPDRRRAAFVLCAVEGLEPTEAAEVLDVSPNAMRSLLCRARQDLETILAHDEELGRAQ